MNHNYFSEKRLLKRCADGDAGAQEQFALISYLNQIYRTATEVNLEFNRVLTETEIDALCKVLTIEIYKAYNKLPHWRRNLYAQINRYVFSGVLCYIRKL